MFFFTQRTFSIFYLWLSLEVPTWILTAKVWSWQARSKLTWKPFMFFYPAVISHFRSFGCHLVSQLGSLRQKCDPGRCDQNLHKSRLSFFTQQTFFIFTHLAVTWGPSLDPCCKSVILTGAIKIYIKVVYAFLPSRHFPFSFLWLSLGVTTWILAAKVWSWQLRSKFT